ncbi:hypothetical protein EHQ81_17645 [Leptospira selangorensis]|uniref:Tetratricopeptide repeat protein n=1 Tax=Leptospira selangorensis TaxID=2484982 RepID=A0A5F2C1V5_9LEPT|nr:hypothetical protein [Leptospira selangorensis]TGM11493.1 hypothetical protein EHQ81_17645 [Leptospira selangorensis]TGM21142.1 hypothetical protein EHQ82_09030 [Leptospira selangorensis]
MAKYFRKLGCLFLLLSFSISCSSLLKKEDYVPAKKDWSSQNPKSALESFPSGEKGTFITALEKAIIGFYTPNNDISKLQEIAEENKSRLRFSASRELRSFFYSETPEGYYASEAEVIFLHILLGFYYAKKEQYEEALVEARYASNLLNGEWSAEGQFDDPNLRILLASLWTACGDWQEAKIDLRAALKLSPKSAWLRQYAYLEQAPKNIFLVLGGPGPEPFMDPEINLNFVRGLRKLGFEFKGERSELLWVDLEGNQGKLYLTPSTQNWYQRHLDRDNSIHEIIDDSKYFQLVTLSTTKQASILAAKVTGSILTGATIVALGAGITYLGVQANSSEIGGAGIIIAIYGIELAAKMIDSSIETSKKEFSEDLDISSNYRYVRFLPEYLWFGTSKDNLRFPKIKDKQSGKEILRTSTFGKIPVTIGFYPDVKKED